MRYHLALETDGYFTKTACGKRLSTARCFTYNLDGFSKHCDKTLACKSCKKFLTFPENARAELIYNYPKITMADIVSNSTVNDCESIDGPLRKKYLPRNEVSND